jgi:hypothetical protein
MELKGPPPLFFLLTENETVDQLLSVLFAEEKRVVEPMK